MKTTPETDRAACLYEALRPKLGPEHNGEFIVIHPESGDYLIGKEGAKIMLKLYQKYPDGTLIRRRIGPPTDAEIRMAERFRMERYIYEASEIERSTTQAA